MTPYTLASLMQSTSVMTSATSFVDTFSPFHLFIITIKNNFKALCSQVFKLKHKMNSPKSVSNPILKVDEIVFIDAQQVTSVEVQVSFLVDIMQPLLLSLLQVSYITTERRIH